MICSELDLLAGDGWKTLLGAYLAAHERAAQASRDFDGWLPRLSDIAGLAEEEISQLHGKLIAVGLLRFRLADRTAGVLYQVNTRMHAVLSGAAVADGADEWDAQSPPDGDDPA